MHTTDLQLSHMPARLRDLYLHWNGLRAGTGLLPRLASFDLHHLVGRVNNIAMAEVLFLPDGTPADFRILFIGTRLRADSSHALLGCCFSELPGKGPGSRIWAAFHDAASHGQPLRAEFPYEGPNPAFTHTNDILLPLACDADRLRYVLAGVVFLPTPEPDRTPGRPVH